MRRIRMLFAHAALASGALAAFQPGDLVLVTGASGVGPGIQPAVLLIKTAPWSAIPVLTGNSIDGIGAYDAFRDRIVIVRANKFVSLVDSTGAKTELPYPGDQDATLVAPTGDGRIYFLRIGKISFFDAAGTVHDLLAVSGSSPYAPTRTFKCMWFDARTNSLVFGGSLGANPLLAKLPLVANGSRIASAAEEAPLSLPGISGGVVVGISTGPSNLAFVKIDDNSNNPAARMVVLDTAAMQVSLFASSNYFGVGAEVAGCYHAGLNVAVSLDTLGDNLRTFVSNSSGAGAIVLSGTVSSAGGSSELATMFPITAKANPCPADLNHDGIVEDADFSLFVFAYNILDCTDPAMPAGCQADLNHDGLVDDSDFSLFVVAYDALLCP